MESVMGHVSSINGTWDVGQGWRERMRKDEWPGSAEEDEGSTEKVTGMTVKEKRERCNEGDREVNSHTKTELS